MFLYTHCRRKTLQTTLAVLALSLLALSPKAHAESWDFNTVPEGLNYYDPFPPVIGPSATFIVPGEDGTLRVQNSESPELDAIVPGLGTARAGVYGNEVYTDFIASVDVVAWNSDLTQDAVLGARGQNIGLGTTTGYFGGFDYNPSSPSTATAFIGRSDNEVVTTLNFASFDFNTFHQYQLIFQGIGADLQLSIYDITPPSARPGFGPGFEPTLVTSFATTDATYSSGVVGAFAVGLLGSTTPVDFTFDNLSASAVTIPETSSFLLLTLGVGGAFWGLVRRKSLRSS